MRVVEPHEFKKVKRPKHTRRLAFLGPSLIVCLVIIYGGVLFLRPLPGVNATPLAIPATQAQNVPIAWPENAQSAVGAVGYGVLATHGSQTPLPTASVAKVMTALAVLKQHPLKVGEQGPVITITQEDVDYYDKVISQDGSNTPVALGEEITEYQALQALLLPSSNNMAHTLARWAYGSESDYVSFVNNFAKTLGMTSAHFDDASGFSPKTVATSEDLARLAVNAMDNEVIAEIAAQQDATIPVAGDIHNVNVLLGHSGIVGLKTGNTDQAGGCFMAAAVRMIGGQKITAVSVVMGAPDLGTALRSSVPLIKSVLDGFGQVTLVKAGQTVGSYSMPWGGTATVQAKNTVSGVIWRGLPNQPDLTLQKITTKQTPVASQTSVGTVRGTFGRVQVETPVVLVNDITPPPLRWKLELGF